MEVMKRSSEKEGNRHSNSAPKSARKTPSEGRINSQSLLAFESFEFEELEITQQEKIPNSAYLYDLKEDSFFETLKLNPNYEVVNATNINDKEIKRFEEVNTKPNIEGLEDIERELYQLLKSCSDELLKETSENKRSGLHPGSMANIKSVQIDRYGFVIDEDLENPRIRLQESKIKIKELKPESIQQTLLLWETLSVEKKRRFIQKITKKGVPNHLRGELWKKLANIHDIHDDNLVLFPKLLLETSEFDKQIERDLARSMPQKHIFFQKSGGVGQTSLFNVLKAYSIYDQKVGYCQGMGIIAAIFLLYVSQEEAFSLLMKLITQYEMSGLFEPGFPTLYKLFFIHDKLLDLWLPNLNSHFKEQGVEASMYAFGWYTTLFVNSLSFPYVIRILDLFMAEGVKVLLRISIAILKILQKDLLRLEFDNIVLRLRNLNKIMTISPEELITCAMEFTLSDKRLEKLTKGYNAVDRLIKRI